MEGHRPEGGQAGKGSNPSIPSSISKRFIDFGRHANNTRRNISVAKCDFQEFIMQTADDSVREAVIILIITSNVLLSMPPSERKCHLRH